MKVSLSYKGKISNDLLIIIIVFFFTIISIFSSKFFIENPRVKNHKDLLKNIEAQDQLISLLRKNTKDLQYSFYKYKSLSFGQDYKFVYTNINTKIIDINEIINVILKGGIYNYRISLITQNNNYYNKYIIYKKFYDCKCLKLLHIQPLLKNISDLGYH